ncbi:MAG: hypothetical protein IKI49_04025 [Oscillospiraceae bacterium]|nr:hypothetical protein [Oscillospiraceae bacterium]
MIAYITENWATILTAAAVIALLAVAFAFLSGKNARTGCDGDCGRCGEAGSCDRRDDEEKR